MKTNVEGFLQKEGFNFKKEEYEALMGYLDFNKDGKISSDLAKKFIIDEDETEGQARIERRVRAPPPAFEKQNHEHGFNTKTAL